MKTIVKQSGTRNALTALVAGGALAAAAMGVYAQQAPAPAKKMSYDNFKMVQIRNIFDPDRSRDLSTFQQTRPVVRETPPPVVVSTRPPPPEWVELTGVMTAEDETYAFFAGTQTSYNKVAAVNGDIAGATITKITSAGIEVSREGRSFTVPVGMTVPLNVNAEPGPPPTAGSTSYAPGASASAPSTSTTGALPTGTAGSSGPVNPQQASQGVPLPDTSSGSTSSSPAPADGMSDAMRRMIERRQQQLNNNQ